MRAIVFAIAMNFVAGNAAAESIWISSATPGRNPLFHELYRQAIYARAKHLLRIDAVDAAMVPSRSRTTHFVDFVSSDGGDLRIRLWHGRKMKSSVRVKYPDGRWNIMRELDFSSKAAKILLKSFPTKDGGKADCDLTEAYRAFNFLDVFSLIFAINSAEAACREQGASPEALRLMSAAYAWLSRSVINVPTASTKLFDARALSYARLAAEHSLEATAELAFALRQAGRDADALSVIARSGPNKTPITKIAEAMAKRDSEGLSTATAMGLHAAAWIAGQRENEGEQLYGLLSQEGIRRNFFDLANWGRIAHDGGGAVGQAVSEMYLAVATSDEMIDLIKGVLPETREMSKMARTARRLRPGEFIRKLRELGAGNPREEFPLGARARLLQEIALDAAFIQIDIVRRHLGLFEEAFALERRLQVLGEGIPAGKIIESHFDYSPSRKPLYSVLPLSHGILRWIEKESDVERTRHEVLRTRRAELEDLLLDLGLVAFIEHAAVRRLIELAPYDTTIYSRIPAGPERLPIIEEAIKRLGDRPHLLIAAFRCAWDTDDFDASRFDHYLDRLLAVAPSNYEATRHKSLVLIGAGKLKEAKALWNRFLSAQSDPFQKSEAQVALSRIALLEGDIREARRLAESAAKSRSVNALNTLAVVYEESDRFDLAYDTFEALAGGAKSDQIARLLARFQIRIAERESVAPEALKKFELAVFDGKWKELAATPQWMDEAGFSSEEEAALWAFVIESKTGGTVQEARQKMAYQAHKEKPSVNGRCMRATINAIFRGQNGDGLKRGLDECRAPTYDRAAAYYFFGQLEKTYGNKQTARRWFEAARALREDVSIYHTASVLELGRQVPPAERERRTKAAMQRDGNEVGVVDPGPL